MTWYLFEPLLDSAGKQLVRTPEYGEWYVDPEDYPSFQWIDEEERKQCINGGRKFPIITLRKFEDDPLGKIREVYERFKNNQDIIDSCNPITFWQAISETIKELEGI